MTTWNGKSEWTSGFGARNLVRIGKFTVPRQVEWNFHGEKGDPDLHAVFAFRDGRPECVELSIKSSADGRQVRTTDLQELHVDKMVVSAFTRFAMRTEFDPETNVTKLSPVDDERELWDAINNVDNAVNAPRRGITPAEIRSVAETYRANVDGDPTTAVMVHLGYGSRRTAERRIKQAEEAGLLPPTTPGKKRT